MKNLILLSLFVLSLASCSKDDDSSTGSGTENTVGRFDNTPFKWDFNTDQHQNNVFIGYLGVDPPRGKMSIDPPIIYAGGVFPYISINEFRFDREVKRQKKPYDLTFGSTSPLIFENIDDKGTYVSYSRYFSKAINSQNFKEGTFTSERSYSVTECRSYKDVEKGFPQNASLAKTFVSKMSENKKSTKNKSIYFAKISITSIGVRFDSNPDGFFKEESSSDTNSSECYIKRMKYGKYAYIAIESEYSYAEVRTQLDRFFDLLRSEGEVNYDKNILDILSKSSVTTLGINNEDRIALTWGTSLEAIDKLFQNKFTTNNYGALMYIEVRSIDGDKVFVPNFS